MNAKQYERLLPYKINLDQAKSNFVRLSRSSSNELREIYNEVFKKDLKQSQLGCNRCVLNMLNELRVALEKYELWKERFGKKGEEENNNEENKEEE